MRIAILAVMFVLLSSFTVLAESKKKTLDEKEFAPHFMALDAEGKVHFSSSYYKKTPVILSFFFPGCKPCSKEMPRLESWIRESKLDWKIFFIGNDEKDRKKKILDFSGKLKLQNTVLLDVKKKITGLYKVKAFPTIIIINIDGEIVYRSEGYNEEKWNALTAFLENLAKQK